MSIAYWKDFYSIMCYGKIPERKETMQKIEPTTLEELERRLQSMIEAFDQQREEEQSDMLGYPHMQNFLLLTNALVAVHQAQHLESVNAALQLTLAALLRAEERELNS